MIKFENVSKIYNSRADESKIIALDDISFGIKENEFVSISGKSGAGKTTLLKLIIQEETPTHGKVFFAGEEISKVKRSQMPKLRRRIGIVFQDYKLFPSKTVFENIAYIMEVMGAGDEEIKRDVCEVLEIVGLSDRIKNFPKELSGGERQKVAIARALIHRPEVILADEPTGNLDPYSTSDVINLLLKIYNMGTTVVLATHNKEIINKLKKRVITLDCGRIIRDEEHGRFTL
jgi:cell division transport system ATP-binding protein